MMPRLRLLALAALLPACTDRDPKGDPGETEGTLSSTDPAATDAPPTSSDPSTPTNSEPTTGGPPDSDTRALAVNRAVDILFVIDNSGSMAEEQSRLAANAAAFFDVLDAPDVRADYRIGFTTTDAGNPRCAATTPENGGLTLKSCVDRVAEGEFMTFDGDVSSACTDFCNISGLTTKPTPIDQDDSPAPRMWIERTGGATNLVGDIDTLAAFQCLAPQGVVGCGFESHLEAMYKALAASNDKNSATNYGFTRQQSLLSLVFVTDETDCSSNPQWKDIFVANKVFWSSPDDPAPTSAVCWRAGVSCSGAGPTYEACSAENWDDAGSPGAPDDQAVLHPVGRYIDFVQNIESQKQQIDANQQVLVSLIAGVPVGYDSFAAEIAYKAAEAGSEQQLSFGVAPGCVNTEDGSNSTAIPPVREREVAEAFAREGERNLFSICQDSYVDALAQIAAAIDRELPPSCADTCVADRDPATPELEPQCTVTESLGDATRDVAACVHDGSGWKPADGASVCFYMLTDPDGRTASTLDDMTIPNGKSTPECSTDETNLEFKLLRVGPRDPNATYRATCVAAANDAACEDD